MKRAISQGGLVCLLAGALAGCGSDAASDEGGEEGLDGVSSGPTSEAGESDDAEVDTGDEEEGGELLDLPGDSGAESGADETGGDACSNEIPATIRDFRSSHVDFEAYWGSNAFTGLVMDQLGSDDLPVYNPNPVAPPGYNGAIPQITSEDSFNEWYRDIEGVNMAVSVTLPLTETSPGSGVYSYDADFFFPVDGMGFNDETFPDTNGDPHNFHFTTEVHTQFTYEAGQSFTFSGDDDLWLFVNGQLALDLGGLHGELTQTANFDDLGLTEGQIYSMDLFHAERRHDGSHFRIDTTVDCFTPID